MEFIERGFSCDTAGLIMELAQEHPDVTAERKSLFSIRDTLVKVSQACSMSQSTLGVLGEGSSLQHLLIFGITGGIFKLTALHLKRLGVSRTKVDSLLQDMHWKALRRLEQISLLSHRLEHDGNQGIQCRPLANKRKHGTQPGWGSVCSIACWAPPFPLNPK